MNLLKFEEDHGLQVTWDFLANSHGKGTVDAIGGVVKNVVHRRVISQNHIVTNAQEFCSLAIKQLDKEKINVIYVDADEMTSSRTILQERLKLVLAIPQIQKMHHFEVRSPAELDCWPSSQCKDSFKKTVKFSFEPAEQSVAKRGRGRPRKQVAANEPAEKKKRGRPPKP